MPTGSYAVGHMTFHWVDAHREETATPAPRDKRELVVYVWYPASHMAGATRYLPDWPALAPELPPRTATALRDLRVVAQENASVASAPRRFPIVYSASSPGHVPIASYFCSEIAEERVR